MILRYVLAAGLALFLVGCDGASGGPDAKDASVSTDTDATGGDGSDEDGTTEPDPWAAPEETTSWRALYKYRGRPGCPSSGSNEIWLHDPAADTTKKLTTFDDIENLDPPVTCSYGCFVSDDVKWIAVTVGPPTADGFSFRIGQFTNANMDVKLIKDLVLEDKVDFKFAGSRLYYSEKATCAGASCQYDIWYYDLDKLTQTKILTFPPATELEQSTYKGHFKVSPDGDKLILLNTTIRSVGVYMWKSGTGLVELDYLCKFGTKGNCQGTGSEYADTDPVAISHDSRHAVFFTFSERWQRARVYHLEDPGVVETAVLASVPQGSFIEKACEFGALEDWQWPRVVGDPMFTPDDREVVFLTERDCAGPNGSKPQKAQRNLVRVKLDTLRSGKTLEEADIFNVTRSPAGDVTANVYVTAFDLTPDGATVIYTGTPKYGQSGDLLSDSSTRNRNDRELWRARLDGTNVQQVTNDLCLQAESPTVIPPGL